MAIRLHMDGTLAEKQTTSIQLTIRDVLLKVEQRLPAIQPRVYCRFKPVFARRTDGLVVKVPTQAAKVPTQAGPQPRPQVLLPIYPPFGALPNTRSMTSSPCLKLTDENRTETCYKLVAVDKKCAAKPTIAVDFRLAVEAGGDGGNGGNGTGARAYLASHGGVVLVSPLGVVTFNASAATSAGARDYHAPGFGPHGRATRAANGTRAGAGAGAGGPLGGDPAAKGKGTGAGAGAVGGEAPAAATLQSAREHNVTLEATVVYVKQRGKIKAGRGYFS